ncbi:MAG: S41 family peptidase [Acidobacteria bacterium]|nr:S41 family peptidase [Acidobacteriota bacterium]MDW7983405.1 S41 family peptidase [Acidobacteriota bacterium]
MRRWQWWILGSGALAMGAIVGVQLWARYTKAQPPYRYFKIFTEVLYLIDQKYVEPPDYETVRWSALVGMAKALGRNTSVLTPEIRDFWVHHNAPEGDVGLRLIDDRRASFLVLAVWPGSPAAEAGLAPGDIIYAIDDAPAIRMTAVEAYYRLRGAPGTRVRLAIWRHRADKPEYVDLVRKVLPPVVLQAEYDAERRVGSLRLYEAGEVGDQVIRDHLRLWQARGLDGLVLDLRGCTELRPVVAWHLANLFLAEGSGGQFQGSQRAYDRSYSFQREAVAYTGPLVVVQDRSTGWACEVLAAVLQDHQRAVSVGERSRGTAAWYDTVPVNAEVFLWLPVALYRRVQGAWLGVEGLPPTIAYRQEGWNAETGFISGTAVVQFAREQLQKLPSRKAA